jgi:hypothetical protein
VLIVASESRIRISDKLIDCSGQTNIGNDCYPGNCVAPGWCDYCGNAKCCKLNTVDPNGHCKATEGGVSSYKCVKNEQCKGHQLKVNKDIEAGYTS